MSRAALMLAAAILLGGAGSEPELVGEWARQDGQTRIRIAPCGDALCAVNLWVRDPAGDEKVGDTLRMRLDQTSPTEFSGPAHDVRRDMNFSMNIQLAGTEMQTSGCVMFGMLCRSAEWTRVR